MRKAVDAAEIIGWEGLEGTYFLPDFVNPSCEEPKASALRAVSGTVSQLERPAVAW